MNMILNCPLLDDLDMKLQKLPSMAGLEASMPPPDREQQFEREVAQSDEAQTLIQRYISIVVQLQDAWIEQPPRR